jgi:hypothetical protein
MQFSAPFPIALLLVAPLLQASSPPKPPVKVILQFEYPASSIAIRAMETSAMRILAKTISLRFGSASSATTASMGRLVLFEMKGYCTMDGPAAEDTGSGSILASTFVSDGVVLPFGEVSCDRVRASLGHAFGTANPEQLQYRLGLALAHILTHELYHMLSGSVTHTRRGLTQSSLTPLELVSAVPDLPSSASDAMENAVEQR